MTEATFSYSEQWMSEKLPNNDMFSDPNLLFLKNTFFEEVYHHSFSIKRIVWLFRWLGLDSNNREDPSEHYQNEDKKVKLLKQIWSKEYFHPFLTTEEAAQLILGNKDKYVISLSSTIPGSVRISYWKNGVKHHRIDLTTHKTSLYSEIIEYDLLRLEMAIEKLIQNFCLPKNICEYISS